MCSFCQNGNTINKVTPETYPTQHYPTWRVCFSLFFFRARRLTAVPASTARTPAASGAREGSSTLPPGPRRTSTAVCPSCRSQPASASSEPAWTSMEPVWTSMEPVWTSMEPVWTSSAVVLTSTEPVWASTEPVWASSAAVLTSSVAVFPRRVVSEGTVLPSRSAVGGSMALGTGVLARRLVVVLGDRLDIASRWTEAKTLSPLVGVCYCSYLHHAHFSLWTNTYTKTIFFSELTTSYI